MPAPSSPTNSCRALGSVRQRPQAKVRRRPARRRRIRPQPALSLTPISICSILLDGSRTELETEGLHPHASTRRYGTAASAPVRPTPLSECSALIAGNPEFTLSLMDHRFLAGDRKLYDKLAAADAAQTAASRPPHAHHAPRRDHPRAPRQVRQHPLPSRAQCEGLSRRPARRPRLRLAHHALRHRRPRAETCAPRHPATSPSSSTPRTSSPPSAVFCTTATAATTTRSTGTRRTPPPKLVSRSATPAPARSTPPSGCAPSSATRAPSTAAPCSYWKKLRASKARRSTIRLRRRQQTRAG